jgi:DNA-binding transcriptional LysR family regulator
VRQNGPDRAQVPGPAMAGLPSLPDPVPCVEWSFGLDGSVTVPIRGNFHASNGDALVAAALAGQGLVYEPTFLLGDEIRLGQLIPLTLDHPPMESPGVFDIYASNRRPPAKVRAFIDFLVERLGPIPPWDRELKLPA